MKILKKMHFSCLISTILAIIVTLPIMSQTRTQSKSNTKLQIPTLKIPTDDTLFTTEEDPSVSPSTTSRLPKKVPALRMPQEKNRSQIQKDQKPLSPSSSSTESAPKKHLAIPTLKDSDVFTSEEDSSASSTTPTLTRRLSSEEDSSSDDSYSQDEQSSDSSSSSSETSSTEQKKSSPTIPTLKLPDLFATEEDSSVSPLTTPTLSRKSPTQQGTVQEETPQQAQSSSSSSSSSTAFSIDFSVNQLFDRLSALKEYGDSKFFYEIGGMVLYDKKALDYAKQNVVIDAKKLQDLIHQYVASTQETIGKNLSENEFFIQKNEQTNQKSLYCIIGDIHGSIHSLEKILKDLITRGYLNKNLQIINPNFYIVFTGDAGDRGLYGVEVWDLLLKLTLANRGHVYLLRGNHESAEITARYGFNKELEAKYPDQFEQLIKDFTELYSYLPQALFTKANNMWMAFFHGGLDTQFDIAQLLKKESPNILICQPYDSSGRTGFMWYDQFGDSFSDRRKILPYIDSISAEFKKLDILCGFRGHQHYGAGVKIVNPNYEDSSGADELIDATEDGPITISTIKPPVITFTTATEGGPTADLSSDVCYGFVTFNEKTKQWQVVPRVIERKK